MIAVIDYGVGNLFSLSSSLRYLGQDAEVTCDKKVIQNADRVILPGVGAFGDAIKKLESTGLIPVIKEEAKKSRFSGSVSECSCCLKRAMNTARMKGLG